MKGEKKERRKRKKEGKSKDKERQGKKKKITRKKRGKVGGGGELPQGRCPAQFAQVHPTLRNSIFN